MNYLSLSITPQEEAISLFYRLANRGIERLGSRPGPCSEYDEELLVCGTPGPLIHTGSGPGEWGSTKQVQGQILSVLKNLTFFSLQIFYINFDFLKNVATKCYLSRSQCPLKCCALTCPTWVRQCGVKGEGIDSAPTSPQLPGFEIVVLPLGCISWATY